jgi:hypothetical protein
MVDSELPDTSDVQNGTDDVFLPAYVGQEKGQRISRQPVMAKEVCMVSVPSHVKSGPERIAVCSEEFPSAERRCPQAASA